ncbi:hypothetical protein AB6A40_008834 [Gnathostoma spinigerum]|uniref:Hypoxia up-regulated protein 1 n=1 Tax=Gnathostoma spinigerum TaxID=75299 RepID=A0ABD6F0E5_9BILA
MEIIVNEEARRKTPNLITIKDGERLFSDAALSFSVKQPQHAFMHLVDLLGKDIDNPIVHLYRKRFPFMQIVPDEKRNTVQFVNQNETYSVESLVAMVLSNAQKIAESFAGQGVSGVVITVPAFFNQAERKAVRVAAQIAGLNLLQARFFLIFFSVYLIKLRG